MQNALQSRCNKVIDQLRIRCLCLAVPADNYGFEGCVVPIGRQGIRPSSKEDPRMTRGMAVCRGYCPARESKKRR